MLIVIVGPTGVGKTKLSIKLAKRYNAEIINADSMQFYKGLDIGTSKIKEEEKEGITHHLFDICNVKDNYTVSKYQKDGRKLIKELKDNNKNIIVVGGTGLYIKALLYDYRFKEAKELNNYDELSNQEIFNKIETYEKCNIHINDRKRLKIRLNKLEQKLTDDKNGNKKLYEYIMIGLTTNRKTLYKKINARVDLMFKDGLLDEVKHFYNLKINSDALNSAIGYKELYKYLDKEISLEEAILLIKKNSRRYAKRQYTFFNNKFEDIIWFNTDYENFQDTVNQVIEYIDKNS